MLQRAFFWMQGKLFPLCGGSVLDNYVVKLYARAYRDLDGIYTYIAENPVQSWAAFWLKPGKYIKPIIYNS